MSKKIKISKKVYETVFSFKIDGTMAEPIVPTPPPDPPPFPPLEPYPPKEGYPGYPNSPFDPLPPIEPYYGVRPWRQLVYRYERDYGWNQYIFNQDWTWGEDAIQRYNAFKESGGWGGTDTGTSTGNPVPCHYSFSIPPDRTTEETILGFYPEDEPIPSAINRWDYIAEFAHYYTCGERIEMGEGGLEPSGQATFVVRVESFSFYFTGEIIYA